MPSGLEPQLSDLRESGAIEQDADIVMFIYRPEYYGIKEYEDQTSTAGMADIIIAKHRSGGTGKVRLRFVGKYARFENPEVMGSITADGMSANTSFDSQGQQVQARVVDSKLNTEYTNDPFNDGDVSEF